MRCMPHRPDYEPHHAAIAGRLSGQDIGRVANSLELSDFRLDLLAEHGCGIISLDLDARHFSLYDARGFALPAYAATNRSLSFVGSIDVKIATCWLLLFESRKGRD